MDRLWIHVATPASMRSPSGTCPAFISPAGPNPVALPTMGFRSCLPWLLLAAVLAASADVLQRVLQLFAQYLRP